jgi:hypothetical protein
MTKKRDCEARKRCGNQKFRANVSGGNNSIAPNAKCVNNYYNYADSTAAVVKQKFEKYFRDTLAEVQRELDECPQIDVIHFKYLLHRIMPRKYSQQIEQLHSRYPQGATLNISLGSLGNNKSQVGTVTPHDRLLPSHTAADG